MQQLLDVRTVWANETNKGNTVYSISLPVDWVRRKRLNKGDKVLVFEDENGKLVIEHQ